jgi:transposase
MVNRRIGMSEYKNIIQRLRHGESDRQIERETKMGRHSISKIRRVASKHLWLLSNTLLPDDEQIKQLIKKSGNPTVQSSATGFHSEIKNWLSQGATASRIHAKLVEEYGYRGHYNSIQRYVKKLKANEVKLTSPLYFKVGEAAQVDFGKGPDLYDERTKKIESTWFFVMTLCYSRHQYAVLVTHQNIETWLLCHQQAFEWFNGVVSKVIIDNPKCAITKACYYEPTVQRSYQDFASSYGFIISACPPREPKKKGRVESGVKYIKQNFLSLSEFSSLQLANTELKKWITEKAGKRVHGTTFNKPLEQFQAEESSVLKALPDSPVEITSWHKVCLYKDCHVRFEKNKYSAPSHHYNEELWLKVTPSLITIIKDNETIATHARLYGEGIFSTKPEHMPVNSQTYHHQDASWCMNKALTIGPFCTELTTDLLSHPTSDLLRAAQGIIKLGDKYGHARLETACSRALSFQSSSYQTVKSILEKELDLVGIAVHQEEKTLSDVYQGHARNQRNLETTSH